MFDWTYRAREKAVMDKSKRELMNRASGGREEKRTKIEVQERRSISGSVVFKPSLCNSMVDKIVDVFI